jgi:hypothetical protein
MENTAVVRVGRLMEIRVRAGYRTVDDVDRLFNAIADEVTRLPASTQVVVVADWRACPLMSEEAAESVLVRMTRNNPRAERSAVLASRTSPVAVLQFLRLVKQSQHPDRKLFYDRDAVVSWLGEILSPAELARLREFTLESPGVSA